MLSRLQDWNNQAEVTCGEDLQQLVNHTITQLLTSSSSAPEGPATAPSSASQRVLAVVGTASMQFFGFVRSASLRKVKDRKMAGATRQVKRNSLRHALKLNRLAWWQLCNHVCKYLQAVSSFTA